MTFHGQGRVFTLTWFDDVDHRGSGMAWRVGVDSGGTFTDVCLFDDASGRVEVWKGAPTPDDPSVGIAAGIVEAIARVGASPDAIGWFGHGTTVATNALIQHRGARTG